jgi:hypothetical protein
MSPLRFRLVTATVALTAVGGAALASAAPVRAPQAVEVRQAAKAEEPTRSTPACSPGSLPETTQGRAPRSDVATGRYAQGYTCNVEEISHSGTTGGYRVERYVDEQGNECAFYDSTLLWPSSLPDQGLDGPGTYVLDMKDPAKPVVTDVLRTPAFQSPHESVRLNTERGLLVAAMGYPTTQPGVVDVFDVRTDCRTPTLLSSLPVGFLGHEGGFAPDGNTYWIGSLYFHTLTAIDLTDPRLPRTIFATADYEPHGMSISADGNTLYMAEAAYDRSRGFRGMTVLDVSQVQARVPNPKVSVLSRTTWPNVSTPQNSTPFTSKGRRYVLHTDEFGSGESIGAARILDVEDIHEPKVVSQLRLAVNEPEAQGADLEADPGNDQAFQGYQAHYCSLPSRVDPTIVACSFILSGLRVFDISDVRKPREIAYHNKPVVPGSVPHSPRRAGSFAMSAPAYDQETGDIWYSDGNSGFYVVRLVGSAKRPKFASRIENPGN